MQPLPKNKCNVTCEWMRDNRLLINPDGQVIPCCYLANVLLMVEKLAPPEEQPKDDAINVQNGPKFKISEQFWNEPVLREYVENKDDFNVFKRPLEDILKSDWFTKTLPESWDDSDRLVLQCANKCSTTKHRNYPK